MIQTYGFFIMLGIFALMVIGWGIFWLVHTIKRRKRKKYKENENDNT
jgi:large-conductance mechanosensitive channel